MLGSDAGSRDSSDSRDGAGQPQKTPRARVLVVDDDVAVVEEVESLLLERGYAVERALDGVAAIGRIERGGIDVVLLDIRLLRLSGWDVLDWIQTASKFPAARVLVYTGTGLTEGAFGRCRAVAKWEPPEVLLQRIDSLLQG